MNQSWNLISSASSGWKEVAKMLPCLTATISSWSLFCKEYNTSTFSLSRICWITGALIKTVGKSAHSGMNPEKSHGLVKDWACLPNAFLCTRTLNKSNVLTSSASFPNCWDRKISPAQVPQMDFVGLCTNSCKCGKSPVRWAINDMEVDSPPGITNESHLISSSGVFTTITSALWSCFWMHWFK